MKTTSKDDKIYIGRKAGQEIIKEITNAKKSIKIVSPYLSPEYIKELIALHKKGKEITLITADSIKDSESFHSNFRTSDLLDKNTSLNKDRYKKRKSRLYLSFFLFFASIFSLILYFISSFFVYTAVFLFFISIPLIIYFYSITPYDTTYTPIFRIKVFDSKTGKKPWSTELVHSKIFVIDESICFLGSANFTYSGFETHYETVIKVEDINAIRDISQEIENLYNSHELKAKPVKDWASL
ncbi:phospholipase D family protein [Candidatus Pacearchaeota archaeon]|nr:phospholipase D family protein [Candidatus Pacearchaeota archaeon]